MLIITRKVGETIHIGDNISVKVLGIQGGYVRLGTRAPKELAVNRNQIHERIKAGISTPILNG